MSPPSPYRPRLSLSGLHSPAAAGPGQPEPDPVSLLVLDSAGSPWPPWNRRHNPEDSLPGWKRTRLHGLHSASRPPPAMIRRAQQVAVWSSPLHRPGGSAKIVGSPPSQPAQCGARQAETLHACKVVRGRPLGAHRSGLPGRRVACSSSGVSRDPAGMLPASVEATRCSQESQERSQQVTSALAKSVSGGQAASRRSSSSEVACVAAPDFWVEEEGEGEMEVEQILVIVEIPKGGRNKYEYDEGLGRFRLDRMLFSSVHYPSDYGYVEGTLAEDGDALDAMVVVGEATFPGCAIWAKPVGLFKMWDEKGLDHKVLCVPVGDPQWNWVEDVADVPEHLLLEIEHFFSIYKDLEMKKTRVAGWEEAARAWEVIEESQEAYAKENG